MSLIGKRRGRPTTRTQFDSILKKFIVFAKRDLRINSEVKIILIDDADFAKEKRAFGMMKDQIIYVSIINRHPIDILRTLSHELVHYKQRIEGKLMDGTVGSSVENQANAKAGEIMRKYGHLHPELFDLMPIR